MRTGTMLLATAGLLALGACTNSTADMRNSIDNAVDRIEERAARVRDAAGNSARDVDKAVHGR